MLQRNLGHHGPRTTRMGIGMAALGRPGYINLGHAEDLGGNDAVGAMEQQAYAVLDAAWAAGVRYYDTARSYGRGEAFLGNWLRSHGIGKNNAAVGSKWGYTYTARWRLDAQAHEVKDHSLAVFERQWRETQAHLGDYLDLYQIHSVTPDSGVLDDQSVLAALAGLRERGVLVGLSLSGPQQGDTLRRAMEIVIDGARLFGCVQATWNVLEPSAGAALAEAHRAGLGVIVKEAVANGRLTERNNESAFAAERALLQQHAAHAGVGIDALALAAALAQPWADVVLSGASTVAQLRSNVRAADIALDETTLEALTALAEPPDTYWNTRKALPWN